MRATCKDSPLDATSPPMHPQSAAGSFMRSIEIQSVCESDLVTLLLLQARPMHKD